MTTNELDNKILEKIRKTLSLANDKGATEQERETAMRMAHGLLAKHNLSMAQVEKAGKATEAQRTLGKTVFYGRPWAQTVSWAVAKLCFCEYVVTTASSAKNTTHWFIGRESNSVTAGELAQFLVTSILKESKSRARRNGGGNAFARSFATGAAAMITKRVNEMMAASAQQTAENATPGTSLVLASVYATEKDANIAYRNSLVKVREGKARRSPGVDYGAFNQGSDYGRGLQLGRQITGSQSHKRISN